MKFSSRKPRSHWLERSFRSYVRLNCNYDTKIRKEDN